MDIGSKINPLLTLNYMQAENENKYFSCKIKTLLRRMHEKITYDTGVLYGFLSIPITAYAAKDETSTYEYEVRDGKAVLTRYATDSNATRITVPQEVDGYEVRAFSETQ